MSLFTPDELAAMRRADAWIEKSFRLTQAERAAATRRDREALRDAWDAEHRRAADRDAYNAKARAYYAANRERISAYQRAYRAKRREGALAEQDVL